MTASVTASAPANDFPFYNGRPETISLRGWLIIMAAIVLGFLALTTPLIPFKGHIADFLRSILFFAIPLAAFRFVTPGYWTAIFRKVGWRDVLWMVAIAILNIAVTFLIGMVVTQTVGAHANPAVAGLQDMAASDRILFFLKTAPQLFGEEVLTILPFLALMTWGYSSLNLSRRNAMLMAWVASAILFGLAHLPTYNWDLFQCIVVIGSARLVLSLAYMITKNIWVSTGAHIINDWSIFALTLLLSGLKAGA